MPHGKCSVILNKKDGIIYHPQIYVPPLKIQGIKTKLVETIAKYIVLEKDSVWFEPFMGSGVVGFNLAPRKAVFADTNPSIISFYEAIKNKQITSSLVRSFLQQEGAILAEKDDTHYYFVRERFNKERNPLDFLFLNRSCFNGMMRFNQKHEFNVPYGHKPKRFSKAYVTKIVHQVEYLEKLLQENDWQFFCCSFEEIIKQATCHDFIYCDPPYIGRHVDYYDSWDEVKERTLKDVLFASRAKFMVSTWNKNAYRKNDYIDLFWQECQKITMEHFYHIGAKQKNQNPITEALLLNYATNE